MKNQGKWAPERKSNCKDPEEEMNSICLKNRKASVYLKGSE